MASVMEKMRIVKEFYTSRHYSHCAEYGERLLTEARGDIHPLHLAYFNFYIALSHDTLAREATLKNRTKELRLAEQYYTAIITALTPSLSNDRSFSPISSATSSSSFSPIWRSHHYSSNTSSFDSTTSSTSTSNTTDLQYPELNFSSKALGHYNFPRPPSPPTLTTTTTTPTTTTTTARPPTPEEYQFAADTLSFVHMVQAHLESVRELREKTDTSSMRFTFPSSSCSSTFTPKPTTMAMAMTGPVKMRSSTANLLGSDEAETERERENIRQRRKEVQFRPRFDPSGVRELCGEALAELYY